MQSAHGGIAYAASRIVHYAQEGLIIVPIGDEAHVCQRVFDLLALVETGATVDAVRYACLTQLILYDARLRIGAVHDGYIVVTKVLGAFAQ